MKRHTVSPWQLLACSCPLMRVCAQVRVRDSTASKASSTDRHSTSILVLKPAAVLALTTAWVMSPALHTWLSAHTVSV